MKNKATDAERLARCRCSDPEGRMWIYLNAFCPNRENHLKLEAYGFPKNSINISTRQYHDDWMSGRLNDTIPPESWPGYRPEKETSD
jgi:hypothetical protein